MSISLSQQVAIVTGASSGIGRAIALAMAKAGASVTVDHYRDGTAASEVCDEISATGGQSLAIDADVSNESEVKRLFSETIDRFDRVDIVVANAGIQQDAALVEMSLEQWNRVLAVNLTGQFLCIREAVKQFLLQGVRQKVSRSAGKIICMSSVHEIIPWAGHVNYAASKGGLNLLMQSTAQEVADQSVRINSIAPGAIRTPINQSVWSHPEGRAGMLRLIPKGRIGDPQDVAKAAVWLASDESDYVHGTTLFIDGGMTLYPGFSEGGG